MASHQSPPKKPRLSLQIKTAVNPPAHTPRGFSVDPKDPTTFNTLSNAYVTAIERSTPVTAINTLQSFSLNTPAAVSEAASASEYKDPKHRVTTPYVANYPETPVTAGANSPPPQHQMEFSYPSAMTATPPLSAGPADASSAGAFSFSAADTAGQQHPTAPQDASATPAEATNPPRQQPQRPATLQPGLQAPYSHPRSLHSILRNSPLPPRTAIPPPSPRRQSLRLQERAAKRVEYHSPLTQDIITRKYTKSHIDLLVEEASPSSPALPAAEQLGAGLDLATAFAPNEIEDGGQTPGPLEDARRRMGGLAASGSPLSPAGVRKRKRKEKKRRWVWTIGQEDGENEDEVMTGGTAAAELGQANPPESDGNEAPMLLPRIAYVETPTPSIESSATDSADSESFDVDMSDASSLVSEDRGLTPAEAEPDLKTPVAQPDGGAGQKPPQEQRDTPIPELTEQRDTPVPPELCVVSSG